MSGEMIKIQDLAGLSKPLTRLIEVIAQGVGAVSESYLIRRTAEARVHEIKVISKALANVGSEFGVPVVYDAGAVEVWQKPSDGTLILKSGTLEDRAGARQEFRSRKMQENVERITSIPAAEMSGATDVPNERPDEDWVTRFFGTAQEISTSEMQELWGRILAGEIKRPGSYSLRALDFLKNINKEEAGKFERLGQFALESAGVTLIAVNDKKWLEENRQIFQADHFQMGELGLMYQSDLALRVFIEEKENDVAMMGDGHVLRLRRGKVTSEIQLTIWKFTTIGRELLSLITKDFDEEYYEHVGRFFVSKGAEAEIGKVVERIDRTRFRYELIKKIEA